MEPAEMHVVIQARHMDVVPEDLKSTTRLKIARLARHHPSFDHAEVHFTEEHNPRISDREICEVTMKGNGNVLRAKAASPDALASLDLVIDKLIHQMEKLH